MLRVGDRVRVTASRERLNEIGIYIAPEQLGIGRIAEIDHIVIPGLPIAVQFDLRTMPDNYNFFPSSYFFKESDLESVELTTAAFRPDTKKQYKMSQKEFDEFLDFVIDEHIKKVMCAKSAEYAQGGDKLHNFRRAGTMHGITPIEALRGMKLKHDCSIEDMLDGLNEGKTFSQELWQEKLHDQINYTFLLWALLHKENGWELK